MAVWQSVAELGSHVEGRRTLMALLKCKGIAPPELVSTWISESADKRVMVCTSRSKLVVAGSYTRLLCVRIPVFLVTQVQCCMSRSAACLWDHMTRPRSQKEG